jgi:hypothetical protein
MRLLAELSMGLYSAVTLSHKPFFSALIVTPSMYVHPSKRDTKFDKPLQEEEEQQYSLQY